MAEPKTLEEAIVAYEENRFSRKSLLRFMVDRQLATETALAALRGQVTNLLEALVRARTERVPELEPTTTTIGTYQAMEQLRVEAEELGVKVDKRWGPATLADKISAARSTYAGANYG